MISLLFRSTTIIFSSDSDLSSTHQTCKFYVASTEVEFLHMTLSRSITGFLALKHKYSFRIESAGIDIQEILTS